MTLKYKATYHVYARKGCSGLAVPMCTVLRTLRQCGLKEAKDEMERLDGEHGAIRTASEFTFDVMFDDAALGRMTALAMSRKDADMSQGAEGWYMLLADLEPIGATRIPLLIQQD